MLLCNLQKYPGIYYYHDNITVLLEWSLEVVVTIETPYIERPTSIQIMVKKDYGMWTSDEIKSAGYFILKQIRQHIPITRNSSYA